MVEKGIRGGMCHFIYWYTEIDNKYIKDYDKNTESPYLQYWDVGNLYGWEISQKLPVNNLEWIEDTSRFKEDFIRNNNEESGERNFLEVDV